MWKISAEAAPFDSWVLFDNLWFKGNHHQNAFIHLRNNMASMLIFCFCCLLQVIRTVAHIQTIEKSEQVRVKKHLNCSECFLSYVLKIYRQWTNLQYIYFLLYHFLVCAVPLTPKSDQHLHVISPYNITPESHRKDRNV